MGAPPFDRVHLSRPGRAVDIGAMPPWTTSDGAEDEEAAERLQRASDAAYRWLYAPLARRSRLLEWPWQGRSRMPAAYGQQAEATAADWLSRCSFLQAVDALWCPDEAGRGAAEGGAGG